MKRRFAGSVALGAMASLVTLAVPAAAPAQEEEGERGDRQERRARVIQGGPGAVLIAGRAGGYLGIRMAEVGDEEVERLGLPEERGALVVAVVDGTPAADAGLQADDVIVSWNGERVESAAELSRRVRETPAGRTVRLGLIRGGAEHQVALELGEPAGRFRSLEVRPSPEVRMRAGELRERLRREGGPERARLFHMGHPRLGVSVMSLTEQLGEHFGAEGGEGALISGVRPETPAAKAGLRAGDVILSVAGEKVEGPGDITRILRDHEEGPVEVRILRDRRERTVTVDLEKPEAGAYRLGAAVHLGPGTIELELPEVRVAPLPPLPALEPLQVEIEVDGFPEAMQEVNWDAYADRWKEWAERWEERVPAWEARWEEWAERWREWSDRWSEEWKDRFREWRESQPFEVIEVSRSGPVFL